MLVHQVAHSLPEDPLEHPPRRVRRRPRIVHLALDDGVALLAPRQGYLVHEQVTPLPEVDLEQSPVREVRRVLHESAAEGGDPLVLVRAGRVPPALRCQHRRGTHLHEELAAVLLNDRVQRAGKVHRRDNMVCPRGGSEVLGGHHGARHAGHQARRAGGGLHAVAHPRVLQRLGKLVRWLPHQRRVERPRHLQFLLFHVTQLRENSIQPLARTGDDRSLRTVHSRQPADPAVALIHGTPHDILVAPDRHHTALGRLLHRLPPQVHESQAVRWRHESRSHRGGYFTNAVPHDQVRSYALAHPPVPRGQFDDVERHLRGVRSVELGRVRGLGRREHERHEVRAAQADQIRAHAADVGTEVHIALPQAARHVGVLRTLSRKQEADLPRACRRARVLPRVGHALHNGVRVGPAEPKRAHPRDDGPPAGQGRRVLWKVQLDPVQHHVRV
mmetsp:Transcript_11744/g.33044  ORF Transcript_11744/g.33044 Transcript_11744/m.33044 type:complete len:444 (+) Transcript_11744:3041-4372(+)